LNKIRIAIVGIGNCASSLIQGIAYYKGKQSKEVVGLMHWEIGGFKPYDIEVVAAFDIDKRKVGRDVVEAIFEKPNCTTLFCRDLPSTGAKVRMGRIMDGVADHMKDYEDNRTFVLADQQEPAERELIDVLKESGAEILLNYLPLLPAYLDMYSSLFKSTPNGFNTSTQPCHWKLSVSRRTPSKSNTTPFNILSSLRLNRAACRQ